MAIFSDCKMIYKYRESSWISGDIEISSRFSFRKMKSLSCPGCDYCLAVEGSIHECGEDFLIYPTNLKNGELYQLVYDVESEQTDYESGIVDDWFFTFVPVT